MAHKLLLDQPVKKEKRYTLPNLEGKFGLSLYLRNKEIFIGIQIGEVTIEQITRKRFVKLPKSKVKVFNYN